MTCPSDTRTLRQHTLDHLREHPELPVLIVGGGINGIGVLRDLHLQGVDALLVERGDFCGGTSAASTRIIHGGLRYLENGEFRLVREAIAERSDLLTTAPHYVQPLPITIPLFNRFGGIPHAIRKMLGQPSKPADRGTFIIRMGLTLYDVFAGAKRGMPPHHFTGRAESLQQRPQLNPAITATATYYDAMISYPERLCLELLPDPTHRLSALNYVSVVGATGATVTLRDEQTGDELNVKPQIVVNASGAWIDFTNEAMQRPTRFIGGTKGSHIVIDHPELYEAARGEMLYFANADGRVCIFYPFYDKIIAGSTDIPVDDPDSAVCDDDEVDYILTSMRQVFPDIEITREHIVYRFCGVRPLPRSDATTTGQISRDHSCEVLPPGDGLHFPIYALVGGKWTTFRAFAEQVTDRLLRELSTTRQQDTRGVAIGGGRQYPRTAADTARWLAQMTGTTGLPEARLMTLLRRYGLSGEDIPPYFTASDPLTHHPDYSRQEIDYIARCEQVVHLDDIILRRTLIGILGETTDALLREIAEIAAPHLGWSAADIAAEVERTAGLLAARHGMSQAQLGRV